MSSWKLVLRHPAKSLLTYHREAENGSELVVSAQASHFAREDGEYVSVDHPIGLFQLLAALGLEKFSGGLCVGDDVIADSQAGLP